MVSVHRLAAVILAGALVAPAVASAEIRFAGQRASSEPILELARDRAALEWDRLGVTGCTPTIDLADDLGRDEYGRPVRGRGWSPTRNGECRIALRDRFVSRWLGRIHRPFRRLTPRRARQLRRIGYEVLYMTVFHEVGHSRELEHPHTDPPAKYTTAGDFSQEMTR